MATPVTNTRISSLAVITSAEIAPSDVIVMSDLSAGLSKKMEMSTISAYVLSASLSVPTSSVASSASFATFAPNSTSASYAVTASHVITTSNSSSYSTSASYATTASWALGVVGGASVVSSSYAVTASQANLASQAYTLIYTGVNNGTAFAAITSSYAYTASYVSVGGQVEITASWAENVIQAETASHIYYDGQPNGTASYALNAYSAATAIQASRISKGELKGYSIFGPYTSSVNAGNHSPSGSFTTGSFQISHDNDATLPASSKNSQVWITATGVVSSSWTGSSASAPAYAPRQISLSTYCFDTSTFEHVEMTDINTHIMGTGASSLSGSTISQFIVTGLVDISGSYRIIVSGSNGVRFDDNRPTYFRLESNGQNYRFTDQP